MVVTPLRYTLRTLTKAQLLRLSHLSLAGFTHREVINNVSEAHGLQKFMLNAEQRQHVEAILRCFITKFIFDALKFRERLLSCAVGNQHAEIDSQDNIDVRECLRFIPVL